MKRKGLTLVEVGVAMGIILLVAIPASRMFTTAVKADEATEQRTRALILAQLILESKVRVVPFDSQQAGSGTDAASNLNWTLTKTAVTPRLNKFEVSVTAPGTGAPLMRLATLAAKEN